MPGVACSCTHLLLLCSPAERLRCKAVSQSSHSPCSWVQCMTSMPHQPSSLSPTCWISLLGHPASARCACFVFKLAWHHELYWHVPPVRSITMLSIDCAADCGLWDVLNQQPLAVSCSWAVAAYSTTRVTSCVRMCPRRACCLCAVWGPCCCSCRR